MSMADDWKHPIGKLRVLGMIEGLSFVLLVGGAMPLKYMAGQPIGVKVMGPIHGLLFVWLCVEVLGAFVGKKIQIKSAALVFFASLFPLGPFLIDGRLKKLQAEFDSSEASAS